jgi:predicted esterase
MSVTSKLNAMNFSSKHNKNGDRYLCPYMNHNATIIWLGGLGNNIEDFNDMFVFSPHEVAPVYSKVVLMNGPLRNVTVRKGTEMRCW